MPCVVNFKYFLCLYFLEFFNSVLQPFILVIIVLLFKNGGKKEEGGKHTERHTYTERDLNTERERHTYCKKHSYTH